MNKYLAFYVDSFTEDIDSLFKKIHIFLKKDTEYDDIVVFTNSSIVDASSFSIFPTFYAKFYKGTLVFMDVDDYNIFDNHQNKFLYIESLKNHNLFNYRHNTRIIMPDNESFKVIDNEKLQQAI